MKLQIWSSAAGLLALLTYAATAVGGFFSGYFFWLQKIYPAAIGTEGEILVLIMTIVMFAAAGFAVLAILFSIFGIPKALWIIFTILSLACAVAVALVVNLGLPHVVQSLYGFVPTFMYIQPEWISAELFDFIGFWLAAGGSLLAMLFGIFTPKKG